MTSFPTYVPAFSTRENEIRAYVHADSTVKDNMLPLVTLTGDPAGEGFTGNLRTLLGAAGGRPMLIDFDPSHKLPPDEEQKKRAKQKRDEARLKKGLPPYEPTEAQIAAAKRRKDAADKVRETYNSFMDRLLSPADGYAEWRQFSSEIRNAIPVIKLDNPAEAKKHAALATGAGQHVAFRVNLADPHALANMKFAIGGIADGGRAVVVLDGGYIRRDPLSAGDSASNALKDLEDNIPSSKLNAFTIVLLGGSFPTSLEDMPNPLKILESFVFDRVKKQGLSLVYGDYASISHKEPSAFAGAWRPHIEVCHQEQWHYVRAERGGKGDEVGELAATLITNPEIWPARAACWGTDMIQRAANGNLEDTDGKSLTNPGPWISIRVNQHLTQQALSRAPGRND